MLPVFRKLEIKGEKDGLKKIADHINALQDELFSCLLNLTSENIPELSLDITTLSSAFGSEISGDMIVLKGKDGNSIKLGYDKDTGEFYSFE